MQQFFFRFSRTIWLLHKEEQPSLTYSLRNNSLLAQLISVEARYNEGPRGDWQNLFAISRPFIISRFFYIYFTITGVEKVVRYIENFVT